VSQDQFVSYAQNHEDVVLARALHPDREPGFWIDIGAGDPIAESVTAAFSERGWRGINVEPLVREYESLCAARPKDINICAAVGATSGSATLFEGPDHDRGGSTMRSDIVASHGPDADRFTSVEVPVYTLAELVAEHVRGPVDFLKIDVEGFEHDVIAGADFSQFRPRVLVVEATFPNTTKPSHESWEPLLLDAGYEFAMFDGLNRFYATADEPDLKEALSIPANILDRFVAHRWLDEFGKATQYAADLSAQLVHLQDDYAKLTDASALGWRTARYAQDLARVAEERAIVLHDELGAAQMRSARSLAEVAATQAEIASAREEVASMRAEIDDARDEMGSARGDARLAGERVELLEDELAVERMVRAELAALRATRTLRYTARVRSVYGMLRRALRIPAS
jgi:FkbM family methyltransferase